MFGLLFFLWFLSRPQPALPAADWNFVLITEHFSSIDQVNEIFKNTLQVPLSYGDFIYLYIARGRFDSVSITDKNLNVFPRRYINGNNGSKFLLLFYNEKNPQLLDVWQGDFVFQAVLPSARRKNLSIKFFHRQKPLPVMLVRMPHSALYYRFADYTDHLAVFRKGQRFFVLQKDISELAFYVFSAYMSEGMATRLDFSHRPVLLAKVFVMVDTVAGLIHLDRKNLPVSISDTALVEYTDMDTLAIKKIYYATDSNFAHRRFYPCPRCLLRYVVAKNLLKASRDFAARGYRIVLFDCYRPFSVQKAMWEAFPNKYYLAPPTHGSMHNRGMAVDISLARINGRLLDMGTGFDFFGPAAHPDYPLITPLQHKNRELLQKIMEKYGFRPINTEWWHFSWRRHPYFPVLDLWWSCP